MKTNWPLTQKEVEIYKILYYSHYKPLVKVSIEEDYIQPKMKKILDYYDWSWRRFMDYKSIDLMQRLVFEHAHDYIKNGISGDIMTSNEEYRAYDPNFGALRLKDNSKSEDPDNFHLN